VFSLVLALNLSDWFLAKLAVFKNSSGLFTLHFASLHSFVLIMIFAHWPAEFELEELNNDSDAIPQGRDAHNLLESSEGEN
jgi:hypothetical protein